MRGRARSTGVVGRGVRVVAGLGLLFQATVRFTNEGLNFGIELHEALLGLVGFPATLLVWQSLRLLRSSTPLQATDSVVLLVKNGIVVALVLIPFTRDATMLFYGASLLLAASFGYAGCGELAIPNRLLRREDEVG